MRSRTVVVLVACEDEELKALETVWPWGGADIQRSDNTFAVAEFYEDDFKLVFELTGAGLIDAASGTQYAIDQYNPDLLVKVGLASGATPKEALGDLYLVKGAIDATYNIAVFGNEPGQHTGSEQVEMLGPKLTSRVAKYLGAETRIAASANYFIKPKDSEKVLGDGMNKDELRKLYPQAGVFDMEDAAVVRVCLRNGTPCVILAGISDDYRDAPGTYAEQAPIVSSEVLVPALRKLLDGVRSAEIDTFWARAEALNLR